MAKPNPSGKSNWTFSPLRVEETGLDSRGRPIKRLLEPFIASCGFNGGCVRTEVPADFKTNYASTPRWTWWIFPPDGLYSRATVPHDYHCSVTGGISRMLADAIFRDQMAALGVPLWKRWLMWAAVRLSAMWAAVRLFSWRHWR